MEKEHTPATEKAFQTLTMVQILLNQGDEKNALALFRHLCARDSDILHSHPEWLAIQNRVQKVEARAADECRAVLQNWLDALRKSDN